MAVGNAGLNEPQMRTNCCTVVRCAEEDQSRQSELNLEGLQPMASLRLEFGMSRSSSRLIVAGRRGAQMRRAIARSLDGGSLWVANGISQSK